MAFFILKCMTWKVQIPKFGATTSVERLYFYSDQIQHLLTWFLNIIIRIP